MSSSNNNPQGNIFLTTENLAFAMPLIFVCSTYAYFKIVPLKYGIPLLAVVFVMFHVKGQVKTLREKKIENMDESDINDLALEFEDDKDDNRKKEEEKKLEKKKARLAERLAAEQRKEEKAAKRNQGKKKKDDDDDDGDVAVFAKGYRNQKKKN
mmetsp:Transcript_13477/g.37914  ORF Transcript_13477/g.37914 Transcript_13477/m.37914 type:complete len:154 (+) Transcript_13477:133-594(+)